MLDIEERRIIQNVLVTLSELRLRMPEAGLTAAKLGISFREFERHLEICYDDMRKLSSQTKALEKSLQRRLKKPAKLDAGERG